MEARSAFTWIGVFAVTRVGTAAGKRPDHRSLLRAQVTGGYSPKLPTARSASAASAGTRVCS